MQGKVADETIMFRFERPLQLQITVHNNIVCTSFAHKICPLEHSDVIHSQW